MTHIRTVTVAVLWSVSSLFPTSADAACLSDPTPACLLDLAATTALKLDVQDPNSDAEGSHVRPENLDQVLSVIARLRNESGNTAGSIAIIRQLESRQGRLWGLENLTGYKQSLSSNIEEIRSEAESVLDVLSTSENIPERIQIRSNLVVMLAQAGLTAEAQAVLKQAIKELADRPKSASEESGLVDFTLVEAATSLDDFEQAQQIISMLGDESERSEGEIALGEGFAKAGDLAKARGVAGRLSGGQRSLVMQQVWVSQIKNGDIASVIAEIRKTDSEDRDTNTLVYELVSELKREGYLTSAQAMVEEIPSSRFRQDVRMEVARAYLAQPIVTEQDMASAEALLALITDSGRSAVLTDMAVVRARQHNTGEVQRLLTAAREEGKREPSPARRADFHLQIALAQLEGGNRTEAEFEILQAQHGLVEIGNPEEQFREGAFVAALQAKSGHQQDADATIRQVVQSGNLQDWLYGCFVSAGMLVNIGYDSDAKSVLAHALAELPEDPFLQTENYTLAASMLIEGFHERN